MSENAAGISITIDSATARDAIAEAGSWRQAWFDDRKAERDAHYQSEQADDECRLESIRSNERVKLVAIDALKDLARQALPFALGPLASAFGVSFEQSPNPEQGAPEAGEPKEGGAE